MCTYIYLKPVCSSPSVISIFYFIYYVLFFYSLYFFFFSFFLYISFVSGTKRVWLMVEKWREKKTMEKNQGIQYINGYEITCNCSMAPHLQCHAIKITLLYNKRVFTSTAPAFLPLIAFYGIYTTTLMQFPYTFMYYNHTKTHVLCVFLYINICTVVSVNYL